MGAKRCPCCTSVLPVCCPQSLTSHAGAGAGQVPPYLYSSSPSQLLDLPYFSLSPTLPLSRVYFSSLLLHPIHLSLSISSPPSIKSSQEKKEQAQLLPAPFTK